MKELERKYCLVEDQEWHTDYYDEGEYPTNRTRILAKFDSLDEAYAEHRRRYPDGQITDTGNRVATSTLDPCGHYRAGGRACVSIESLIFDLDGRVYREIRVSE